MLNGDNAQPGSGSSKPGFRAQPEIQPGRERLRRAIVVAARLALAKIYQRQVAYEFPREMLVRMAVGGLPAGYELRQPPGAGDENAIANLLNQEPGFGTWTSDRVRSELHAHLATPNSAIMILHAGIPIGVCFATDASTRRRRIAHGMYLYVVTSHRGRGTLGMFMMRTVLEACMDDGYLRVLGYTDPDRYSALLLYLSNGARPVYDSLVSRWHWHKIHRRLRPALRRSQEQRARRSQSP